MHGDTAVTPHTGVYKNIDRPKRLVFTWFPPHTDGHDTLVTVDFLARGAGTEIVITHEQLGDVAAQKHNGGWTSALEKLDTAYGASNG
jgi:uncharacterized protein YndB with AHSA1/START domain